jgi:hypothetical protein
MRYSRGPEEKEEKEEEEEEDEEEEEKEAEEDEEDEEDDEEGREPGGSRSAVAESEVMGTPYSPPPPPPSVVRDAGIDVEVLSLSLSRKKEAPRDTSRRGSGPRKRTIAVIDAPSAASSGPSRGGRPGVIAAVSCYIARGGASRIDLGEC